MGRGAASSPSNRLMSAHPHDNAGGSRTEISPDKLGELTVAVDLRRLVCWALDQLQAPCQPQPDGSLQCRLSEALRRRIAATNGVTICFPLADDDTAATPPDGAAESLSAEKLLPHLIAELAGAAQPLHAAPAHEPGTVPLLAQHLYAAYQAEGGRVSLAGCTLEERPAIWLIYLQRQALAPSTDNGGPWQLCEVFLDRDGSPHSAEAIAQRGLTALAALRQPPRVLGETRDAGERLAPQLESLSRTAQWYLDRAGRGAAHPPQQVALVIAWSKWADGKLRFEIGGAHVELRFSGWAATLQPPAWTCPHTGRKTYRLAATDDGRIAAAEEISVCAQSGRRMLRGELRTCAVSGQRVLAEYLGRCEVSATTVLREHLAPCELCGCTVSRQILQAGRCLGCRRLTPVAKSDARLARVLGEYPKLDHWRWWKLSETETAYIFLAAGWVEQALLVFDKSTLEPRRAVRRTRWSRHWEPASVERLGDL